MTIQLSKDWLRPHQRHGLIGKLIIAAGFLMLLIVFPLIYFLGMSVEPHPSVYVFGATSIASPIVTLFGAVYLTLFNQVIVKTTRQTGQFIWLAGVHTKLLNMCPLWQGIEQAGIRR